MSFFVICPCHEPPMVGQQGALDLVTTPWTWQGTDVFLGSVIRTRGRKEKSMVANRMVFFFLWPWSWWVPGSRSIRVRTKTLEKPGAVAQKGHDPLWMLTLQKKIIIFCDGEVFSIDRGLLMGAIITTWRFFQIWNVYHRIFAEPKPMPYSRKHNPKPNIWIWWYHTFLWPNFCGLVREI